MIDVIDLSKYIIKACNESKSAITNLKLQKILYYIQGYYYKRFGVEAFKEDMYCWTYGPVVPLSYYEFNINGASPIQQNTRISLLIDDDKQQLIDEVIRTCIKLASSRLVTQTHQEDPWKNTSKGSVISKMSIKRYFRDNDPLGIF